MTKKNLHVRKTLTVQLLKEKKYIVCLHSICCAKFQPPQYPASVHSCTMSNTKYRFSCQKPLWSSIQAELNSYFFHIWNFLHFMCKQFQQAFVVTHSMGISLLHVFGL